MKYYSFKDDYSEGAHPRILEALLKHNTGQEEGYGKDRYCAEAGRLIRNKINMDSADVHFVSGGTQANLLVLGSILRPYESVIAASSAHIAVHETGSIEATGHKINLVSTTNGKLTPGLIDPVVQLHRDEHMVSPRAVFISQSTESGAIYTSEELIDLSRYCRKEGLFLYMDGARLGVAITAHTNDLHLEDMANLVDVFYIGGTKNGALMGEAIVITNSALKEKFRYVMKQKGALVAKGRLFGIQFVELFRENLFFELGVQANQRASELAEAIQSAGYHFWTPPVTNQIFPIFPKAIIDRLKTKFDFHVWESIDPDYSAVRLVTSWATPVEAVEGFLKNLMEV